MAAALNACDVLLMPYLDGASLRRGTLMAGLANGCAIVTTTPQGPLPELVDGRDLLYVTPEDEKALANAALRIANDPALATRLRTNARERSKLFAWDAIAHEHMACYANPGNCLDPDRYARSTYAADDVPASDGPAADASARRRGSCMKPTRWFLLGLVVVYILVAGVYSAVIPVFEGFDAQAHFAAVQYFRSERAIPELTPATVARSYELIPHPPLYYALSALAAAPWPLEEASAVAKASVNAYFDKSLSARESITLPGASWQDLAPAWAARFVSTLGGLIVLLCTWWMARRLAPSAPTFALAAAAIAAFNPQFLFTAVTISNDAWSAATAALALALGVDTVVAGRSPRAWLWVGAGHRHRCDSPSTARWRSCCRWASSTCSTLSNPAGTMGRKIVVLRGSGPKRAGVGGRVALHRACLCGRRVSRGRRLVVRTQLAGCTAKLCR